MTLCANADTMCAKTHCLEYLLLFFSRKSRDLVRKSRDHGRRSRDLVRKSRDHVRRSRDHVRQSCYHVRQKCGQGRGRRVIRRFPAK